MTKLTINICAEDDDAAMRVYLRLEGLMFRDYKEDGKFVLNKAGYTSSHVEGSGDVKVEHVNDDQHQS